jgi:hypothetical protein
MREPIVARGIFEVAAVAAVSYCAFTLTTGVLAMFLSVAGAVAVFVFWEIFISARAKVALPVWSRELLALAVLGGAALGLARAGEQDLALGFLAAVLVQAFLYMRRRPEPE